MGSPTMRILYNLRIYTAICNLAQVIIAHPLEHIRSNISSKAIVFFEAPFDARELEILWSDV